MPCRVSRKGYECKHISYVFIMFTLMGESVMAGAVLWCFLSLLVCLYFPILSAMPLVLLPANHRWR